MVLAILEATVDSMPTGIDYATLELVTGADTIDLLALQIITTTIPIGYEFTISNRLCKLLPV